MRTLFRLMPVLALSLGAWLLLPAPARADNLPARVDSIVQGKRMTVGVAAECAPCHLHYTLHDRKRFPLMSVFKLHVSLAVLAQMEAKGSNPDSAIFISRSRMLPDTYSPLRRKYPNQDLKLTVRQLIHYAVAESDNNACDVLIDLAGGIGAVQAHIRSLGIQHFRLSQTEADMHADLRRCYDNWSTPSALNALLKHIAASSSRYVGVLRQAMGSAVTGANKIVAGCPPGAMIEHKTGSSDRIDGVKTGDNDVAIIRLPHTGHLLYLSIFVKDSQESDETNAAVIVAIARVVTEAAMAPDQTH